MNDKQRAKLTALGQELLDRLYDDEVFHTKNADILAAAQDVANNGDIAVEMMEKVGIGRLMAYMVEDMEIHNKVDAARAAYLQARGLLEAEDDVQLTDDEKIKWDITTDFGYGSDQR